MTTANADTIGNQLPQPDVRGWLIFDHLPDAIQRAEDATQAHDHEYYQETWHYRGPVYSRPAMPTERQLLAHLGYALPAGVLRTRVEWLTDGVRNRRWPALELQTPNTQPTQQED